MAKIKDMVKKGFLTAARGKELAAEMEQSGVESPELAELTGEWAERALTIAVGTAKRKRKAEPKTERMSYVLTESMADEFREIAKRQKVSCSAIVSELVARYVKKYGGIGIDID